MRRQPRWQVRLLGRSGPNLRVPRAQSLDGRSYELALGLASASSLLDATLPSDLVAMGTLERDGTVAEVGGLAVKLRVLHDWALGVKRLLVAPEQVEECQRLLTALDCPRFEVVPVRSLADACGLAFHDRISERLAASWSTPAKQIEAASRLYHATVTHPIPVLGWAGVARAAEELEGRLSSSAQAADDPEVSAARERAHLAAKIARRHEDHPEPILLDLGRPLSELPRPERLKLLAHIVQSHADAATPELGSVIERAKVHLALPLERHGDDLALLGALGRARAALAGPALPLPGSNDLSLPAIPAAASDAIDDLEAAANGWVELGLIHDASHSLSELLRLLGVLRQVNRLEKAEKLAARLLDDPLSAPTSRLFVELALGRAQVQAGNPAAGRATLLRADLAAAPAHAECACERWLALAELQLPDHQAQGLERLNSLVNRSARDQPEASVLLARIDRCLWQEANPAAALQALRAHKGREVAQLVGSCSDDGETARRVSAYWRY